MPIIAPNAASEAKSYNEAMIRFHIIDPIVTALGYRHREDTYLTLEGKLDYPYIHIGRKSKKDVPVGYADYWAGLKGARGSFVIEAKAGHVIISKHDIEQAHSYAAHAQVGANYFALCNGSEFTIYETLSGPNLTPLINIPLSEINKRFHEIESILSPERLEANCKVSYDSGLKLCNGVGSSLKVRSGIYTMTDYAYRIFINNEDKTEFARANFPNIDGMEKELDLFKTAFQLRVEEGLIQRSDDGRICASARLAGATIHNQVGMQMLGIDQFSLTTNAKFLSTNADNPTTFEAVKDFSLEKGAVIPQLFGGATQIENHVSGDVFIKSAMYLEDYILKGQYIAISDYYAEIPFVGQMRIEFDLAGELHMETHT